ncbi:PREDICTED: U-box domain-containing protein 3-like [Camelina sativa]|uniref:RING-type E3 ubiquitin transferase n=1 Tax=Camelina sativa TaxID=90675 RepID=A0ABM0ZI12_CAMSA|nr:PREDICTED: U-box domain-containing protein 3-like [Camelina sativa]
MDPVPVRCLLNSISRYLHLVACQTIRFNPIQTCIGNMVLLLKLLKPLLDGVVDCKIPSDGCLNKGCEDLDSVVNQARELLEDWSPKLSKLFGVFQCEVLLGKVQTCSLEISRILLQLSQSSPETSSVQVVERCVQEIESFKQEGTLTELMENALQNQKDDITSLDNHHLESIIQMLGLISNQDLLKESIAVEKERIRSQASKSKENVEQIEQLIELVLCIREHMLKTEFLEVAKGISIPPYFRCPLSTELMLDPVIVASGQTFDRTSIKKWLDNGLAVCPRTRQVLTHQELIPNYTVKAMITSWLEANRINLTANSGHRYDGGDASSMANNMGSQDFNRTESFRFSLRSSSFTSRSSHETGNGFEKLKINVPTSLCGESQSKDLEIFEILSPGQSYTHSRSESVCSVVSSVDYVPSVTHEIESILGNHQSSSEMSPKKNSESSSNVNHECSVQDLDDSGTMTTSHTMKLVEDLKSGSNKAKTAAAAEIRHLTISSIENRVHIGRYGAITPLLSLLYSDEKLTQEHAVTALLNLSISELNKATIVEAKALEPLVHVLNTGNDRAKENSAATLFSLSVLPVNRERIGQSNAAIQALVNLLGKGTFRGKKDAASALFNLSITHENKARIVQAKAVKYLVELLDPDLEMVDKAVALLANLSAVGEGRQAIVREGGIPLLVETVDLGSQRGKENAASVLLQLCLNSPKFCTLVLQEGAIPPLVALSQSGTQRAKEKAQQLLSHFRNQRDARMKKGRS